MALIYHIAFVDDWHEAMRVGEYTVSTRGRSLAEVGYIHAGTARQVAPVADMIYRDAGELLLLVIDTDKLASELRYDPVPGWDDPFPHIYGPLNVTAVVETRPLEPAPDGRFRPLG